MIANLGNRIKTLRMQQNLTQTQLAHQLNITKSMVSAYENDLRTPSYHILIKLSHIFHVSTDYLLGVDRNEQDTVNLSGLTDEEKRAIKNLIKAMKNQ